MYRYDKMNAVLYRIQTSPHAKTKTVHHDKHKIEKIRIPKESPTQHN
jgi:hypothetical protein